MEMAYSWSLHASTFLHGAVESLRAWTLGGPALDRPEITSPPADDQLETHITPEHGESDELFIARAARAAGRLASFFSRAGKDALFRDLCRALTTFRLHIETHEATSSNFTDLAPVDFGNNLEYILVDLESLLAHSLEYSSTDEHSDSSHAFPLLEHLASDVSVLEDTHPIMVTLRNSTRDLRKGLKGHCRRLQNFNDSFRVSGEERPEKATIPDHTWSNVITDKVYQVFAEHASCVCACSMQNKDASWRHLFRLLLRPTDIESQVNKTFDLLVSEEVRSNRLGNPVGGRRICCSWRDVCITMERPVKHLQKGVRFESDPTVPNAVSCCLVENSKNSHRKRITLGTLCDEIRKDRFSRVSLMIEHDELWCYQRPKPTTLNGVEQNLGINLADLLARDQQLGPRLKMSLAFILAHTVYEYYDSDWMRSRWTSETITFIKQAPYADPLNRMESGVNPVRPYLAIALSCERAQCLEFCPDMVHAYPRMTALGILLLEIGMGVSLRVAKRRDGDISLSQEWSEARLLAEKAKKNPPKDMDFPRYWTAVLACLDPYLLDSVQAQHPNSQQTAAEGVRLRRKTLYENVVHPLSRLLDANDWRATLQEERLVTIDSVVHGAAATEKLRVARQLPAITAEDEAWDYLKRLYSMSGKLDHGRRVRLAILDTGYDDASGMFEHPCPTGWKDFVSPGEDRIDTDGHGSHLLGLMMMLIPEAEVFVARVAEDSQSLQQNGEAVAQAIDWACNDCKADIVSMSFGFSREVDAIKRAIHTALGARNVLFFAAAANYGANLKEMFPAKHSSVISIRGTGCDGQFPGFNPSKKDTEAFVFGTLGVEVPLNTELGYPPRSGTSVATAIAASYAALLLSYARNRIEEPSHVIVADELLDKECMERLFLALSEKSLKKGYLHLKPWDEFGVLSHQQRWSKLVQASG